MLIAPNLLAEIFEVSQQSGDRMDVRYGQYQGVQGIARRTRELRFCETPMSENEANIFFKQPA